MSRPGDVVFSASMHLRLLLRVDRTQSIRHAVTQAIKPGSRVLDAGCGSGLLSFLALAAGAGEVVAVDRDNIELARALAQENGFDSRIRFVEADLTMLEAQDIGRDFEMLLAFVYTNHMLVDEPRSRMVNALRQRFCAPTCTTIPNRVRYWAIACEWPELDAFTELADLRAAIAEIETRYGLQLGPLIDAATSEILFTRSRPDIYGDYRWMPGAGNGGYRHQRGSGRFLSERAAVCEIAYDRGARFESLPERVVLELRSPGTITAILWVQELWFDDLLIWAAESFSPVAQAVTARPGQRIELLLDDRWRASNLISVAPEAR